MITDHYTKVEFMRYEDFLRAEETKNDRGTDDFVIADPLLFHLWNYQLEQEYLK